MEHARLADPQRRRLPRVGQRITKTTVAVFLCLLIYHLRGYHGQDMPTESAITAIICMQPYVRDTTEYAVNRFAGSLLGALWGLLFLLLLLLFPALGDNRVVLYALMALGVLVSLHSAVAIHMADASSLAAIVFLCVVIAFPDIEDPLLQAGIRMLDVFIGTTIAIVVNVFHLPRRKQPHQLFFVRVKDLSNDRFTPLSPALLFRLNYLHDDGAKICLMSEHAPAFFMLQMSGAKLNAPLIVMDGAAIYDANENRYLHAETIRAADSEALREKLAELDVSYFTYTIHRSKACIFHNGKLREEESVIYDRMKSSPYRSYLEGEVYDLNEVVYFKIIDRDEKLPALEHRLSHVLPRGKLRTVIRPQAAAPGLSALYIYSHAADMEQAKKRLLQRMREQDEALAPVELRLPEGWHSEHEAMQLLGRLEKLYEPVCLRPSKWLKKNG